MKPFKISIVSAAILAAASFGASAQQKQEPAPGMSQGAQGGGQGQDAEKAPAAQAPSERKGGADAPADRAQSSDKAGGDKAGKQADDKAGGDKTGKQAGDKAGPDKAEKQAGDKAGADKAEKSGGMSKDAAQGEKQGGDGKAADKAPGGDKAEKREASKEIKTEQKTVIRETIVKQNIKPQKLDVQVRVGVAIPRTVVLYSVPPTIIEVYPSYSRYRLVMVDDNTILIIDPVDWTIIDVIEV